MTMAMMTIGDNSNNEYDVFNDVYNDVYNDDDHGDDNEEDDLCRGATLHKQFGNFKISSMGRTVQSSPALLKCTDVFLGKNFPFFRLNQIFASFGVQFIVLGPCQQH